MATTYTVVPDVANPRVVQDAEQLACQGRCATCRTHHMDPRPVRGLPGVYCADCRWDMVQEGVDRTTRAVANP
jgi:hypothetical protein